ncbi:MAG: response regulator transcription factor [Chitinophagaceae bacterium]|nr:MAG: response regulator transcription factor [Chitinophagaceae bacterium]
MTNVVIFEDNSHLRETLQMLLNETEGYSCSAAFPNCSNLTKKINGVACDVVLMDIEMPGMNGIEATKLMKENFREIPILIQTAFSDDNYIFDAICAGASGYILKTTTPAGYIEAIREVQAGGSPITPGIAKRVLALFKDKLQPAHTSTEHYNLTKQEKKILQLLVDGNSYKLIAAELFLSLDTVKTHIKNIYAKLHVHSGTEAVSKALRDKILTVFL